MASQVSICNLALSRIGHSQPISAIDEPGVAARMCKQFFSQCREEILRSRPWPWAQRRETLALVAERPNMDWGFAYRYPVNFVKIYQLTCATDSVAPSSIYIPYYDTETPNYKQKIPWQMGSDTQGLLLFTDLPGAIAVGTYNVQDTSQFNSDFVDALAWRIAAEIAPVMTKDLKIADRCFNMAEVSIQRASAAAINEGVPTSASDSSYSKCYS